jgi:hypothetical protein
VEKEFKAIVTGVRGQIQRKGAKMQRREEMNIGLKNILKTIYNTNNTVFDITIAKINKQT